MLTHIRIDGSDYREYNGPAFGTVGFLRWLRQCTAVEELYLTRVDEWFETPDGDTIPSVPDEELVYPSRLRIMSVSDTMQSLMRVLFSHLRIPARAQLFFESRYVGSIYDVFSDNPSHFENLASITSISLVDTNFNRGAYITAHVGDSSESVNEVLRIEVENMTKFTRLHLFVFSTTLQQLSIHAVWIMDDDDWSQWSTALRALPALRRLNTYDMDPRCILHILMTPPISSTGPLICSVLQELTIFAHDCNFRYEEDNPESDFRVLLLCAEFRHTHGVPLRRVHVSTSEDDLMSTVDARGLLSTALQKYVEVVELL